ncbi:hypothetical protein ABID97_003039 [Variovorax sp. OAS795]|uniref:hypothetical protein n=1 Tax=Variovorax sp. OAS795 TaxID=3034231 RepID=UPI003395F498
MIAEEIDELRAALSRLTPAPSHDAVSPPQLQQIYTPEGHEAALDPERVLVVGGRGTGKSFWSATLLNDDTRTFVSQSYRRLNLDKCKVGLGFAGVDTDANGAPSREELDDLIETDGHEPEKVWRAVFLRAVSQFVPMGLPTMLRGPEGLVHWVEQDAARAQQYLRKADEALRVEGVRVVVLFDALDRLGRDWQQIRERTRALLLVTLALRTYKFIKPKIFLRVDQAEDAGVAAFPDASKLLSAGARVDLTWEHRDLFGLLYTLLANDVHAGNTFVKLVERATSIAIRDVFQIGLPAALKDSESAQAQVFVELAGPYMGASASKGRTYTWLHKHLADAYNRVSPRTFLEAVRQASLYRSSTADAGFAISPAGLRAGIQAASELRLRQLKEEYNWIDSVIEPLADQQVPCRAEDLYSRWQESGTIADISHSQGQYLEPIEFSEGDSNQPAAILKALLRIGVAERRADGRINIPDIYRVAAKMLRKGGVRPKR